MPPLYLVRLGHRTVGLRHLILAEDSLREPEPRTLPLGTMRIYLELGIRIDLTGEHANQFREVLDAILEPIEGEQDAGSRSVDPEPGLPVDPVGRGGGGGRGSGAVAAE